MNNILPENDRKAYTEVLYILNHMNKEYIEKVPSELLNFFEEIKDSNYIVEINNNIPLYKNNLQEYTFDILNIINLNFWCENEEQKRRVIRAIENKPIEFKFNEQLSKIYNNDHILKEIIENNKYNEFITKDIIDNIEKYEKIKENGGFFKKIKSIFKK